MIALGFIAAAASGTLARWIVATRLPRPAGTLAVNLVGAGLLGWLSGSSDATQTVVGIAALGSMTTFSTLLVELIELWRTRPVLAVGYGIVTFVGGIGLAWLGLSLS